MFGIKVQTLKVSICHTFLDNLPEAIERCVDCRDDKQAGTDGRTVGWTDGRSDGRAADTCRRCFSRGETNVAEDAVRHSVAVAVPKPTRREGSSSSKGRARADLRVVLEWQSNYKNINLSV